MTRSCDKQKNKTQGRLFKTDKALCLSKQKTITDLLNCNSKPNYIPKMLNKDSADASIASAHITGT